MDKYELFLKNLGNHLKQLRKDRNISQEKVALGIDVDLSFIGRIERAERIPSLKTVYMLADFFDMEISEFLNL